MPSLVGFFIKIAAGFIIGGCGGFFY